MTQQSNLPTRLDKYRAHIEFGANVVTILGGIYAAIMGLRQLFFGQNTISTYLLAGGGAILVLASLTWIGFSSKTIRKRGRKSRQPKTEKTYRYPRLYIWAQRTLLLYSVILAITGIYIYRQQMEFESKIVILLARLDGPEERYGITDELYDQLQETFSGRSDVLVIPYNDLNTPITVGQGKNHARELGEEYRSDIVIWGWYKPTENAIVKIYVENLNPYQLPLLNPSGLYEPQATLNDLEQLTIHYTIDSEMKALIYFLSGFVRYRAGDLAGALDQIELALAEPVWSNDLINQAETFYVFSDIYSKQEKHTLAIEMLTKALELEPDNPVYLNNRANEHADSGQYELAIQDYTRAITIGPTANRYYNRGLTYYESDKYSDAIEDFSKVIDLTSVEINPLRVKSSLFYRGTSYSELDQYDLAIADYTKIIDIDQNFSSAYQGRCRVYYIIKEYELAISDCNQALSLPVGAEDTTHLYLGRIYYDTGQYDLAIENLTKSIAINPEMDQAYYYRGYTNIELSKDQLALSDFQKFIESSDDPGFIADAQKQIQRIEQKSP